MPVEAIRNVGIVAHIDAGKTTTTEQFLYKSGATDAVGRVDNGNSVMDFLPQERERGITISSAAISFKWDNCLINLIDTPGHVDFTFEVERSVRAMDAAVIIVDAVAGVQAQTRTVWRQVKNQNLSCIAFVNKMDRLGSNFSLSIASIRSKLGANVIPVQLPVYKNDSFCGVIDLIGMQGIYWENNANEQGHSVYVEEIIPSHEKYDESLAERTKLVELLADNDEEFLEIYLSMDLEHIGNDVIADGLRRACVGGLLIPALCGASLKGKGVEPLLDAIKLFLPSPVDRGPCLVKHYIHGNSKEVIVTDEDLVSFAFKVIVDPNRGPIVFIRNFSGEMLSKFSTLWNASKRKKERVHQLLKASADELILTDRVGFGDVGCLVGLKHTVTGDTLVLQSNSMKDYTLHGLQIPESAFSLAIEPEKSCQYDSLIKALTTIVIEDPSLRYEVNEESGQLLLHGIGELHLEIVCDKLKRQYDIPVEIAKMFVSYRETIDDGVATSDKTFEYERMLGGKRFYACITGSILQNGESSIPLIRIHESVRKSLNKDENNALSDSLEKSLLLGPAGYRLVGITANISSICFEPSTSIGSIRAGISSFIESSLRALPTIVLEPYMSLQIDLPSVFVGDVLSDLTVKRKATIQDVGTVNDSENTVIIGQVPLSTMLGYASTIRSMTQGQGSFSMEYLGHQRVASSTQD